MMKSSLFKSLILCGFIFASFSWDSTHAEKICNAEKFLKSPVSNSKTIIKFVNNSKFPRNVYWLDFKGKRKIHDKIAPGEELTIDSFEGHVYLVTDSVGSCKSFHSTDRDGSTISFN